MGCSWSLVAVHWTDAFDSENGWVDVHEYSPEPTHVVSVGFLWPDKLKGYICLTGSYMPDEASEPRSVGMVLHIPEGMVNKVVVLGEPNWDALVT